MTDIIYHSLLPLQVFGVQCLGGTGAIRMGADLLHQQAGKNIVYVTDPTWGKLHP